LIAACLLFACTAPELPAAPPGDAVIYVIGRGWHTDIGLPTEEIAEPLAALERPFPGVRFLTFGFGDREFLLQRNRSSFAMLAALLPGRGALLVTALSATPEAAFGPLQVVALHVSRGDLASLQARLWREFELSPSATLIPLAEGPYPGSLFYAASATYSGLYTCNTWTADVARAGGLPIPAAGVLFAGQVMRMARWIATRQNSLSRR